ncbi:hypothetical protein [Bradyrhizobium sp. th.b2]|uniref:hypothetical protein n=1 Tax=Bradyrhizobium sp. th-b2 TaxID=172088 RepID=UPI0012EC0E7C|nr:hypothetical protein [Bradyrhizobium sp. th.b2]
MKSSDIPNPADLLTAFSNYEANVYSGLWTSFRLCYRLREKNLLDDDDVRAIFDLEIAQQLAPANLREGVLAKLRDMRDQCLAQNSPASPKMTH